MCYTTKIYLIAFLALQAVLTQAQQFFFSAERPSACNSADGIITIVPTRGVPPFTYQWSTGATSLSIKNTPKGSYSATVTDATGATMTHNHILNSAEFDLHLAGYKPATFCNPNSGFLQLEPLGGVAPYTFSWSNGQTGATASGLTEGTYSVTVVDATGCQAEGQFEVSWPGYPYYPNVIIESVHEPDCVNTTNGELKAVMKNSGFAPFSYVWSNGATAATATALGSGLYTVTITDALGCSATASFTLQKALTMTGSIVCDASTTGTASAVLVNATAPVTYTWSNGQTGSNLTNLPNGAYTVTATDSKGCSASADAQVAIPRLVVNDNSPKCFAGNNGIGYAWVDFDQASTYAWDNGSTEPLNNTLSVGQHSVTVTTALGCTLTKNFSIFPPMVPPMEFQYSITPADCANGTAGALNITITGGFPAYHFAAFGSNGFTTTDLASLQNIQGGRYNLSVYSSMDNHYCSAWTTVTVPDQSGFNPELVIQQLDCTTGYGAAAIVNATTPGTQYDWSMGATSPDVHNLTPGCYTVTVTGDGACLQFFEFCMYGDDTLKNNTNCLGSVTGRLINDYGVAGCNGTAGIPFQLIRALPSGALNFTDAGGVYNVNIPDASFDIKPASYDPADIACPSGGTYSVSPSPGTTVSGLDFHFLNSNPVDHRVRQRALRTAQPGYPYSLRFEVCNDGNSANPGAMNLSYGNFLGAISPVSFPKHAGTFTLTGEVAGVPENTAQFNFPGIAPGACELLQADFTVPTTTPVNTEFITQASVTPGVGDPTPDNNRSSLFNTVVGSFDPNSVLSYPARNGNPHDGGKIFRNTDRTLTYQVFFQNTGKAPADLVIIRDTLDQQLQLTTIRNIKASHEMQASVESGNVLVFKFLNINLPDSTSDYANSIGSVQYDIDLQPNLPIGTKINKQAAIFFDFNSPVRTNTNVLEVAASNSTPTPGDVGQTIAIYPNPAGSYFGFQTETGGDLYLYNTAGALIALHHLTPGLQRIPTADLPDGVYLIRLNTDLGIKIGKVVVQH